MSVWGRAGRERSAGGECQGAADERLGTKRRRDRLVQLPRAVTDRDACVGRLPGDAFGAGTDGPARIRNRMRGGGPGLRSPARGLVERDAGLVLEDRICSPGIVDEAPIRFPGVVDEMTGAAPEGIRPRLELPPELVGEVGPGLAPVADSRATRRMVLPLTRRKGKVGLLGKTASPSDRRGPAAGLPVSAMSQARLTPSRATGTGLAVAERPRLATNSPPPFLVRARKLVDELAGREALHQADRSRR